MSDIQSIEDLLQTTGANKPEGGTTATEQLGEKIKEVRSKEKELEAQRKAQNSGAQYVNLKGFPISPEALRLIPRTQAKELKTVAFIFTGAEIRIGSTDPTDERVKELLFQLQERHKANGGIYQISEESFQIALAAYDKLPRITEIVKGVKITEEEISQYAKELNHFSDIQKLVDRASVTDIITVVMAAAVQFSTSDVHVEAEEHDIAVRFRLDGVLQDVAKLPHDLWKKIISRVKLVSGLKINITDRPQDGRFTIFLKSGDTDVRVSTIPTTWGESVVMRILKPSAIDVEFAKLGFRPASEAKLRNEIKKPHGMIITTGPTGSGKTTTLYSMLRMLNEPDVKIITLEDPIEYKLEGINQSQIDHTKQYTFASGLRSILRQDPDVVMVGEIRDLETGEIAINAALTGHLLLSTLHTNDAAGALPRFISMGVKPFLLAPALNAMIGQRLVRRVCQECKEEIQLDTEQMEFIKRHTAEVPENSGEEIPPEADWTFYRGKGCDTCNHTGYKGRVGIYEILTMSDEIKAALSDNISEHEVRELAKQQGMVTMLQDGVLKTIDGLTTIDEIMRVTKD